MFFLMMRRRSSGRDPGNIVFGTIGWLFADLMFALAMTFLVAVTVGQPLPKPSPSASPSASPIPSPTPTPSPTFAKGLEQNAVPVKITNVDYQGLLAHRPAAMAALQKELRARPDLRGRQAGLVLTFGGGLAQGRAIADAADDALKELGRGGFVFVGTLYKPYIAFNAPPTTLEIDIYLLRQ